MPWINFENLSNDEAHAIFTYLKSIKLGKNIVPAVVSPNKMYNALSKTGLKKTHYVEPITML